MTTINVYLVNEASLPSGARNDIGDRVGELLRQTISRAAGLSASCSVTQADVQWSSGCPEGRARKDVVIRFIPPPEGNDPGVCRGHPDGSWEYATGGLTTFDGSGTRSVVYVPPCAEGGTHQGAILGSVAFHELMHNKLQLTNTQLHSRGGLAAAAVGAATPLTDANVRLLAPALDDEHTQLCP